MNSVELSSQRKIDALNSTAKKYNMKINVKKTKTMVVSKKGGVSVNILIDGERVEQVHKFKYLGAMMSEDGRSVGDVKQELVWLKQWLERKENC